MKAIKITIPQKNYKIDKENLAKFLQNEENFMRFSLSKINSDKINKETLEKIEEIVAGEIRPYFMGKNSVKVSIEDVDFLKAAIRKSNSKNEYYYYIGKEYYN